MESGTILGEDAYELQPELDYRKGTQCERFPVLTELEWVVTGRGKRQNTCHPAITEDLRVTENIQTLLDIGNYASKLTSPVSQRKNCRQRIC